MVNCTALIHTLEICRMTDDLCATYTIYFRRSLVYRRRSDRECAVLNSGVIVYGGYEWQDGHQATAYSGSGTGLLGHLYIHGVC